jgi:hypothetical protein
MRGINSWEIKMVERCAARLIREGVGRAKSKKKEEFSGLMDNMRPENSFPQIWVLSYHEKERNLAELFSGVNRGRSRGGMGQALDGSTPLSPAVNGVAAARIDRAHNADRKFTLGKIS